MADSGVKWRRERRRMVRRDEEEMMLAAAKQFRLDRTIDFESFGKLYSEIRNYFILIKRVDRRGEIKCSEKMYIKKI